MDIHARRLKNLEKARETYKAKLENRDDKTKLQHKLGAKLNYMLRKNDGFYNKKFLSSLLNIIATAYDINVPEIGNSGRISRFTFNNRYGNALYNEMIDVRILNRYTLNNA